MKKIINEPATVVADAVRGMALAHPDLLRVRHDPSVIIRADAPVRGSVAVVSGGGSGHEPLHGGFVGAGMLSAAVPGEVFTSPTPDAVQAAVSETDGGAGTLLVVKNYTGDVLNFETAAELAAADGLDVRSVVVDDDVAVKDSTHTAGRRGVGGTVMVEKIAGAAAAGRGAAGRSAFGASMWRTLRCAPTGPSSRGPTPAGTPRARRSRCGASSRLPPSSTTSAVSGRPTPTTSASRCRT